MGAGAAGTRWTTLVCAIGVVTGILGVPAAATADVTHPFRPQQSAAYLAAKQGAQIRTGLGRPLAPVVMAPADRPKAVVASPGLNQPGLGAGDNTPANSGSPADPTGAVGPSHYVEFVNSVVRVYNKADLTVASPATQLDTFVSHPGDAVFDPQIQYDPVADRWFYLADDCSIASPPAAVCSAGNYLAYGWSKTSDPSDVANGWCTFRIQTDNGTTGLPGYFDDYPKLGHNDSHLVFGTNVFDVNGNFVSGRIWTVPKPPVGTITNCATGTGAAHWFTGPGAEDKPLATNQLTTSDGQPAFTPVPANTQDLSPNGYVVAAHDYPGSQIMAWHVHGAAGAEALAADGNINVSSYALPSDVPQPGTSDRLDSSDTRLTQAVAHTDPDAGVEAVWTQHTIDGPGGRSVVRWYELLPGSLTRRQEGTVSNSSNFVFNGAISPTMAGNEAVIEYNVGGSAQLTQIRARSRNGPRPLGTMGNELVLGTSAAHDQDFTCSSPSQKGGTACRWGDYAGATPDPSSAHLVWGSNQLMGPASGINPHWTTRNFALLVNVEPIAAFSASPNPAYANKPVTFDASASTVPGGGAVDKYEWDFDGNGTFEVTTTTPQTTHVFPTPGTFDVKLRASAGSATDTTSVPVKIAESAPTALFTVAPGAVGRGQAVVFDGSASSDREAPGGIASYAWDFDGDGTVDQTTTTPTVSHAYAALGTFSPRLIVTDVDDGQQSAPVAQTVAVHNVVPTANLAFAPAAPKPGEVVTFTAAGSNDPDGAIAGYRWDLNGDGVFETDTGTRAQVTRRFKTQGRFTVAVLVRDADGATATATSTVRVVPFKLALKFTRKARLAALLRGLTGTVSCSGQCTVALTLRLPAALARRTKTSPIVAKTTVVIRDSRAKVTRLRLTRSARNRLRGARPFSATLTGTAVNSAKATAKATLTIRVRP